MGSVGITLDPTAFVHGRGKALVDDALVGDHHLGVAGNHVRGKRAADGQQVPGGHDPAHQTPATGLFGGQEVAG